MNKRKLTDGKMSEEKKLRRDNDFDELYETSLELRYPKTLSIIEKFKEITNNYNRLFFLFDNRLNIGKDFISLFNKNYIQKLQEDRISKEDIDLINKIYDKKMSDTNLLLNFRIDFEDEMISTVVLICKDYSIIFSELHEKFFVIDTYFISNLLLKDVLKPDQTIERYAQDYGKTIYDDEVSEILEQALVITNKIINNS